MSAKLITTLPEALAEMSLMKDEAMGRAMTECINGKYTPQWMTLKMYQINDVFDYATKIMIQSGRDPH